MSTRPSRARNLTQKAKDNATVVRGRGHPASVRQAPYNQVPVSHLQETPEQSTGSTQSLTVTQPQQQDHALAEMLGQVLDRLTRLEESASNPTEVSHHLMPSASTQAGNTSSARITFHEATSRSDSFSLTAKKLQAAVRRDVWGSLTPESAVVYERAWSRFEHCVTSVLNLPCMPVSEQSVAAYVAHLHHDGAMRSTTIRSNLSAINFYHKLYSYQPPAADSFLVDRLLKAYAKDDPDSDDRLPITLPVLLAILEKIPVYTKHPRER